MAWLSAPAYSVRNYIVYEGGARNERNIFKAEVRETLESFSSTTLSCWGTISSNAGVVVEGINASSIQSQYICTLPLAWSAKAVLTLCLWSVLCTIKRSPEPWSNTSKRKTAAIRTFNLRIPFANLYQFATELQIEWATQIPVTKN
jgi:hypothetical protein